MIHNHGGPSSRLEGRLLANGAAAHGLRLVSVDRPGMGRSTAQKDRSYEGWCNDLLTIADALGYQQFGVSGWSEGGPWPLAAAFYLDPARLRHVTSIAGGNYGTFGDMWAAKFMDKVDTFGGKLALHHRLEFHLMYEFLGLDATHFRKSYIKTLVKLVNDYDARFLRDPEYAEPFADMSAECFAQGSDPLVDDSEPALPPVGVRCDQDRTTGAHVAGHRRPPRPVPDQQGDLGPHARLGVARGPGRRSPRGDRRGRGDLRHRG